MLTSLLPGFRQVRAPIAAGVLLLAAFVVAFGPNLRDAAGGRTGPGLELLDDRIGERGWLVVAAVAAYLIGSIYVTVVGWAMRNLAARLMRGAVDASRLYDTQAPFWSVLVTPMSRPSLRRLGSMKGGTYDARLAYGVAIDVIFGQGKRLLSANRALFDEYDRMRSEAEFRDAVGLPGVLLILAVLSNVEIGAGWKALAICAGILLALSLAFQARLLDRDAYSTSAHAVADGTISTPTLDSGPSHRQRWLPYGARSADDRESGQAP